MSSAPNPYGAPGGEYALPPRCPDELLASPLPDWAKVVWLAIRLRQGSKGHAWAFYNEYATLSSKSEAMVRKAVTLLKAEGWIEEIEPASRSKAPSLRCVWKRTKGENVVPTKGEKVRTTFQKGENHIPERSEQGSLSPTPPNKEEPVQEPVQEPLAGVRARVPTREPLPPQQQQEKPPENSDFAADPFTFLGTKDEKHRASILDAWERYGPTGQHEHAKSVLRRSARFHETARWCQEHTAPVVCAALAIARRDSTRDAVAVRYVESIIERLASNRRRPTVTDSSTARIVPGLDYEPPAPTPGYVTGKQAAARKRMIDANRARLRAEAEARAEAGARAEAAKREVKTQEVAHA